MFSLTQDVHIQIPRIWEYVAFYGKTGSANVI